MSENGQGFPEWTELGQDSGLDPLGMQRPIEAIYQSLLPGISTITLRFRYYAFFPWILKHYEDQIRHSDPAVFRVFHRRCEVLFALVCCRGEPELGIAGSDWANRVLDELAEEAEAGAVVDFALGADPNSEEKDRYLRNKGGAFGGIYSSQMVEMGLVVTDGERNQIPICSERALPIAAAFGASLGPMAEVFFEAVAVGRVSTSVLDMLKAMKPAALAPGGDEHRLLSHILLGNIVTPSEGDLMRRRTMLMLLALAGSLKRDPRVEDAKWQWFDAAVTDDAVTDVSSCESARSIWSLYQACDLTRLAYETILSGALVLLESAPSRRLSLENLVDQLVEFVDPPKDRTWLEFRGSLVSEGESVGREKRYAQSMTDASDAGETATQVKWSIALLAALVEKSAELRTVLEQKLNAGDHFQSLRTEVGFLEKHEKNSARSVVELLIRDRILKRHLWVASRKFRNQKAYTFLIEPEDSLLRYRDVFSLSPSSPRLQQALRFLKDVKLVDESGLTDLGRTELAAA